MVIGRIVVVQSFPKPKRIDWTIATACFEPNLPLLFSDRDFQPYVEHLGLEAA